MAMDAEEKTSCADHKKNIVKDIQAMSGSKSPYDVFRDWIECIAITIANSTTLRHDDLWKSREDRYLKIICSYEDKGESFCRMFANLQMAYEAEIRDILGEVYMESGCGNKNTGQFFTPFHVSQMMAAMSLKEVDGSEPVTFHEPSCGAGGMIIAAAAELKKRGINYQRCMDVVAQDLDWKAVYMCYIQLSLLGIKAVVVQGDTLSEPYTNAGYPRERVFYTPAKVWRIY